jgi:hypothetical protein
MGDNCCILLTEWIIDTAEGRLCMGDNRCFLHTKGGCVVCLWAGDCRAIDLELALHRHLYVCKFGWEHEFVVQCTHSLQSRSQDWCYPMFSRYLGELLSERLIGACRCLCYCHITVLMNFYTFEPFIYHVFLLMQFIIKLFSQLLIRYNKSFVFYFEIHNYL